MQCCNKHVIIYSGARVSELIRAIRSFISIDISHFVWFQRICDSMKSVSSFSSIDNLEMGLMKAPAPKLGLLPLRRHRIPVGKGAAGAATAAPIILRKKKLNII